MKLPLALLAAALMVPLAIPHAAAQAAPSDDAVRLLEDKGSDVKLGAAGTDQDPDGRWAAADLRALDAKETPDQVTFILTVGSLATSPEAPFVEDVRYGIGFRHLDQVYRVTLYHRVLFGPSPSYGYLEAYDPARGSYEQVGPDQEATLDVAAGTITFPVDRDLLVDREGDAPHPEVPLTDWHATASGNTLFGSSSGSGLCITSRDSCTQPLPYAHDAMPDDGNGTVPLTLRFGIAQSGTARLYSQTPTRASNGEATTIVYQVEAVNRAPRNASFTLAASGVPAGWTVRLPASRIRVPDNSSVEMPILVSVPFAHQHGTYQKFLLEMKSQADPDSVGRIQLGIRYTNPPQPAGHHNALWLHAGSQTGNAAADALLDGPAGLFMNALDTDPLDAHADAPGFPCGTGLVPPQTSYCWTIPLRPQLELGLDFDLARQGTLTLPVKTTLPLQGASLQGTLRYIAPDSGLAGGNRFGSDTSIVVADIVPRPSVDVPPNSAGTILSAAIVPTRAGDYIPYQKGAQLYLDLELVALGAQVISFGSDTTSPAIQPGGLLSDLPLNEYHDKVAQVFTSNSTLQLQAAGPQDRATNPGKTLLFNLTLQNDGDAGLFNLELTGVHLPWARIVAPGDQVHLAGGQSVPVRVAVQVPTSADKGDTADLVLAATSAGDLNVRSLARLFATVDTAKDYPDEASLLAPAAPAHHRTPAPEALLLAPCIIALAMLLRRRA